MSSSPPNKKVKNEEFEYNENDARMYMKIANQLCVMSCDREVQVGAVLVDPKKKIIVGEGCNNFPAGCTDHKIFSLERRKYNSANNKNMYMVHAEANAIVRSHCTNLDRCILYTTLLPCTDCARLIVQAGIETVIYEEEWKRKHSPATFNIFDKCGVTCLKLKS